MTAAVTLGEMLGVTEADSALLAKAKTLGLDNAAALELLAVARGCYHYRQPDMRSAPQISQSDFSNEELAIALLSPNLSYSPHTIRVGAAMLGAEGNRAAALARMAKAEKCDGVALYIAKAGFDFERDNSFWRDLASALGDAPLPREGVMPHPTRFVSMTGITRSGPGKVIVWIRPRASLAFVNGASG